MNQTNPLSDKFMFDKTNKKVIVGLSGGADSIALCHFLKFSLNLEVFACHINHNLRGDESNRDMNFVKEICEEWDIPLFIKSVDVSLFAKENHLTIEEAGRHIRYDFFEEKRKALNADCIATAHTLSDNTETILLNLTRGTGLKGLCGIPQKRDYIVRPLIHCTREDVENYCEENRLKFVTDSTNFKTDYTRNKIRLEVIPLLKEINPQLEKSFDKTSEILSLEEDFLDELAKKYLNEAKISNGYGLKIFNKLHKAIQLRMISLILEENNIEKSYDLICTISRMINSSEGKINVAENKYIEIKNDTLKITKEKDEMILDYFEYEFIFGENIRINGERYSCFVVNRENIERSKKIYKNLSFIYMDYDTIKGNLMIRQRKLGDKIALANSGCTKTLKKLFIEKKLSAFEKSASLVLADDIGVCSVFSIGVDERVKCTNDTVHYLMMVKLDE